MQRDNAQNMEPVCGRNAVLEALRSGRPADSLLIARGERGGSMGKILALCKQRGIPVKEAAAQKLDLLSAGAAHQGVVLQCAVHDYATLEDLFELAQGRGEAPFFVLCDEIEDPHNLGAIIRTAEASGAHGVIVPKRRNAGLTGAVAKAACGALEYLPVARVSNLAQTMDLLKERGLWCVGADMQGDDWCAVDFTCPVALVIGSEGRGLSRLVREKCDHIASLPMRGEIGSLNASVAAGILMYEAVRQRRGRMSNR